MTSASPIISADAVEAVRAGLRAELPSASLPAEPPIFVAGQPSTLTSGGTSFGASIEKPMNSATAPTPTASSRSPVDRPLTSRPISISTNAPMTVPAAACGPYLAQRDGGSSAPSRAAAIGGNPRRAQRRPDRGDHRDDDPDEQRDHDRPRLEHGRRLRQVDPERHQQRVERLGQQQPEEQPDDRRERSDHERLEQHRAEHLAAGRAERAERRQLPRALGDRDRQRVRDHEAPDEQRDPAEREQEVLEDVEEAARVLGRLLRLRLTGPHLGARPEQRLDLRSTTCWGE